ncbi:MULTISPECIES: VanZ family protein [Amycolatopsis]|uniref:VanZ family protein n=1 Tax=Amycolatopsis dendrobii TaxID=2760662 RepID=A0A7W3Z8J5_9PSEU|nr:MULTISPECIES: VanZ family protein [Amycolatopsis]MBB1151739.1 VanZ family protein [Amycolatopsis dendrobii]UKD58048.1 VanZ family protein [Amycolatopsis sp. FU40]
MDTVVERIIPVAVFALPVSQILWVVLAVRRSRRLPLSIATFTAAIDTAILLCGGLVVVLVTAPAGDGEGSALHLIPGQDVAGLGNDAGWQIAGNLVLLAPLAALVPFRVPRLQSLARVAAAAALVSIGIEAVQYLLDAGRVSATDDVLLNTIGATASASLTRGLWRALSPVIPRPREAVASGPGTPAAGPPESRTAARSGNSESRAPDLL